MQGYKEKLKSKYGSPMQNSIVLPPKKSKIQHIALKMLCISVKIN